MLDTINQTIQQSTHQSKNKLQRKRYLIDTNVLLNDSESIFNFEENEVIIASEVILELDNKKSENGSVGENARQTVRNLKEIFYDPKRNIKKGESKLSTEINNDGVLSLYQPNNLNKIETYYDFDLNCIYNESANDIVFPGVVDDLNINNDTDFRLLELCKNTDSILVTNDKILHLFAILFGVESQEYKADKKEKDNYKGYSNLNTSSSKINTLFNKGILEDTFDRDFVENEFVNMSSGSQSGLARYKKGKFELVDGDISDVYASGIKALNREQHYALDVLKDRSIDLVVLTGVSGVGKTLLALAAGLSQVDNKYYNRMLVARPTVPLGEGLGYMPGDVKEKMHPWLKPIYDNLEFIFDGQDRITGLQEFGKLKVEPLQFIRGRSIPNQYFIIDESQNISPKDIKAIITRAGDNTKIVLTGDIQQIDKPYLTKRSNALSYVTDRFKGQENFAFVKLEKSERSRLAEQAAKLL